MRDRQEKGSGGIPHAALCASELLEHCLVVVKEVFVDDGRQFGVGGVERSSAEHDDRGDGWVGEAMV